MHMGLIGLGLGGVGGGLNPVLDLLFTSDDVVDSRITYSGGAGGTYTDSTGVIRPQRVNLWTNSEFPNGLADAPVHSATLVTNGGALGLYAGSLAFGYDGTTVVFAYKNNFTATAGQTYTVSAIVLMDDGAAPVFGSATVGSPLNDFYFTCSGTSSIPTTNTALGNGFYRVSASITPAVSNANIGVVKQNTNSTRTFHVTGYQVAPGTIVTPYIKTTSAAVYAPRIDFDPVTHAAKGVLVEEQRTNLLTYSSDYTQVGWGTSGIGMSVTLASGTAPDGTNSLVSLASTGTSNNRLQCGSVNYTSGTTITFSQYVKAGSKTYIQFGVPATAMTTAAYVNFDVQNGVVGTSSGAASSSITNVGNGIYRCVASFTPTTTVTDNFYISMQDNASGTYVASATAGNILLWGAQLEAGSFATSYIPTTSAQVTRTADSASLASAANFGWFNAGAGTFVGEGEFIASAAGNGMALFSADNGAANGYTLYKGASTAGLNAYAGANSAGLGNVVANIPFKAAVSYDGANNAGILDGGAVHAIAPVAVPAPTQLLLGKTFAGNQMCGHLRRLRYWSRRLPDATLQSLTT